jgi:hypothetical protein
MRRAMELAGSKALSITHLGGCTCFQHMDTQLAYFNA